MIGIEIQTLKELHWEYVQSFRNFLESIPKNDDQETTLLYDLLNNNKNKFDKIILEFKQSINDIEKKKEILGYDFFSVNVPRDSPRGDTLEEIYKLINVGTDIAKNDFYMYCLSVENYIDGIKNNNYDDDENISEINSMKLRCMRNEDRYMESMGFFYDMLYNILDIKHK